MSTNAETEFMAQMMTRDPDMHRALTAAGKGDMPAREALWLSEESILWPDDGDPQDPDLAEGHPLRALMAMLDAVHPLIRDWKRRSECAEHLTDLMASPLTMLLAELESAQLRNRTPASGRIIDEHDLLRRSTEDFVVAFSGHLWDIAPVWSTGRFAGEMVTRRLDIQAATARASNSATLEDIARRENEPLREQIASEKNRLDPANTADWLNDEANWQQAFGWYNQTLAKTRTEHYRHMTAGYYAGALTATPRARAAAAHGREVKNSPAEVAAFRHLKRAMEAEDKLHIALRDNRPELFLEGMSQARTMNAEGLK